MRPGTASVLDGRNPFLVPMGVAQNVLKLNPDGGYVLENSNLVPTLNLDSLSSNN